MVEQMEILWLHQQLDKAMTLKDKLELRIKELEAYVNSLQEANARLYDEIDKYKSEWEESLEQFLGWLSEDQRRISQLEEELSKHAPEPASNTQGA